MLKKVKEVLWSRKIISLFLLFLIITALPFTVLLAQKRQNVEQKAAEKEAISFKNADGAALPLNSNNIPQTTSSTFQVELNSTLGPPVFASPTSTPSPSPVSIPGSVSFVDSSGNVITSTNSPTVVIKTIAPVWPQDSSPVTTKSIILAEDLNLIINKKVVDFTTEPITYTFLNANRGTKTLYVVFISSRDWSQNAKPFPVTINLMSDIQVTTDSVNKTMIAGQKATIFQVIHYDGAGSGHHIYPVSSTQSIKLDSLSAKTQDIPGAYIQDLVLHTDTSLALGTYTGTICITDLSGTCVINIPLTLNIPVPTYKRVFVTSSGYSGDFKSAGSSVGLGTATSGLDGADKICQSRANAANLGGSWKAWLSDSSLSATNRLSHSSIFYNGGRIINGVDNPGKIAENWAGLTGGSDLLGPIGWDEYCISGDSSLNSQKCNAWPGAAVWTNTNTDGSISNKGDCNGWTSSSSSLLGGAGVAGYKTSVWTNPPQGTNPSTWSCNTPVRLYCFEQDSSILGVAIATTQISGTVSYKIADSLTDLDNALEVPYTSDQLVFNYTLSLNNQNPGIKTIFVEFKDVSGETDTQTAQIELVSKNPSSSPTPTPLPSPLPTPSVTLQPTNTPTLAPSPTIQPFVCNACSADVNKDGRVSVTDYSSVVTCFDKEASGSCVNPDINKNGFTDIEDFGCVINMFGQTCSQ